MKILAYPAFKNKKFNPFNHLLYSEVVSHGNQVSEFTIKNVIFKKFEIVHIHWPPESTSKSALVKFAFNLISQTLIQIAKAKGAKIVWTIHNLATHDSTTKWFHNFKMKYFVRSLDGYIGLNQTSLLRAPELYPELKSKPGVIIKHGSYRKYYNNTINSSTAREQLKIPKDSKVVLFFGLIKRYKGVEQLVEIFKNSGDDKILLIAGNISSSDGTYFNEIFSKISGNIKLFPNLILDDDVQLYFNASDIVVLPYKNILNSGTLFLSLSFNKPVLTRSNDSMEELVNEFGSPWVTTYKGDLNIDVVDRLLINNPKNSTLNLDDRGWEAIAKKTIQFYKHLFGN